MAKRDRIEQPETPEGTHKTNQPSYPDSNKDTGMGLNREYPGMPRWVKVSGIITIGLVLLVVVVLLVATALGLHTPPGGPGEHGPRRHSPSGANPGSRILYAIVIEDHISSSGDPGSYIPLSIIREGHTSSIGELANHTPAIRITEHGG